MFSTSTPQAQAPTKATGISIQTSVEGKPIPVVYGRRRVSPNIVWYGDFQAVPSSQSAGGGSGGDTTVSKYIYYASFIMALCEGPVTLVRGYKGSKRQTMSQIGHNVFKSGQRVQDAWGYFDTTKHQDGAYTVTGKDHSAEKAYYPGIAYLGWANRKLGDSASLPNYNFEINGFCRVNTVDCNPATVIIDYLTNQYYGAGFPAENLSDFLLYSKWCRANGLLIATEFTEQSAARDQVEEIIEMTGAAAVWSGSLLKIIPYGETKVVGNGFTYTPPNWTGVNLTIADFKPLGDNEGLVRITRKDRASMYNAVQIEGVRRNHDYNVHIETAQDDLSIQTWGYRPEDVQQAHFFNTAAILAKAAELRLRRLAIANTYEFRLGWEHVALEPMDIVTLTEPFLGLTDVPVRITEIQEDEEGYLSIAAEEVLEGTYNSTDSTKSTESGTIVSESEQVYGHVGGEADEPGDVNEPVIFEPPKSITLGKPTILFSVSGAGEYWGGAEVWASLDNDTYSHIGNIGSVGGSSTVLGKPGRQGIVFGSAFPSGSDPDTVNSLTVDTSESGAEVLSVSREQADAFESLSYVGGELIAYTESTLQEDGTYLLDGYIRRGLYGSTIGAHAVGEKFCALDDDSIAAYRYPTSWITNPHRTVYFKFRSFDIYGDQVQELDDCTAYGLEITGASYNYIDSDELDETLAGYMPLSYLDTDAGMAANSDTKVPSQKATRTALDLKAPLASPPLTGTPTAPNAAADTDTTQIATCAFVLGQASGDNPAMDGTAAPGTSKKYSRADHVHPTDTSRAPLASPTFTGTPAAPSPASGSNDTTIPTTAWVKARIAAGGSGGARALYSGLMSDLPTQSNTGFSTWVNQGSATVADTAAGLVLSCASVGAANSTKLLVKSVPTAPYTITALIACSSKHGNYPSCGIGWRDSSSGKYQFLVYTNAATPSVDVANYDNPTTFNAGVASYGLPPTGALLWCQLYNDGTTIYFKISVDGKYFFTVYSIAKSSGFLGSSGYNQLCLEIGPYSYDVSMTLMSYKEE